MRNIEVRRLLEDRKCEERRSLSRQHREMLDKEFVQEALAQIDLRNKECKLPGR